MEWPGRMWAEYHRAQRWRRHLRLAPRTAAILALRANGFQVDRLSVSHFRVDQRLDLFPVHRGYHDLETQARGEYRDVLALTLRILRGPAAKEEG